ncbi:Holliday junction resolvase RuvX [Candidatus Woesebacteria bacterium]|nr:Holliday junction resolvase RuvX [Candidatus Woesebacteria bacterium]
MKILAVDYGRKKIGLALGSGFLAEPWKVIRFETRNEILDKIKGEIKKEGVEKIIVGVSEGEMGRESERFSLDLARKTEIPVETFDETLSTHEAQVKAIAGGVGRKKRKTLEDAFAAAVMLQSYLDTHV